MAKKSGGGKKPMSQKLGSGTASGVSGMDLSSKLEKHAGLPYKGVSLGSGVTHGAKGLLGGTGAKKNAKVPQ